MRRSCQLFRPDCEGEVRRSMGSQGRSQVRNGPSVRQRARPFEQGACANANKRQLIMRMVKKLSLNDMGI